MVKSGVSIFGINGSVTELNGETATVTPTTSQQTITPTGTGKNALTQVTVNAVTNAIDNNITAGNIKNGVSILGVTGSYQGTDTSDATAIADNIMRGKTAYVNGQKITGTLSLYTELEYIQSDGGQYIDTLIAPTNHYVEIKAQYTSNISNSVLLGIGSTNFHITWYDNKWYFGTGSGESNGGASYLCTNLNTFVYGKDNQFTINGNLIQSNINPNANANLHLLNRPQKTTTRASAKIYYCKIFNKSTGDLVRDFVPAKDKTNVVCLYDRVSGQYFYNQGTGSFTAGQEVAHVTGLQNKTVTPSTSQQLIQYDTGYFGLDTVTIDGVTSSIDNNITARKYKKSV